MATRKTMTLWAEEFIRRFLMHVMPRAFIASAISAFWETVTAKETVTLPTTAGYAGCTARNGSHQGLPGTLRRTHRLLLEGMPSLSPGTYGEDRSLAAHSQMPNGDHGHVMTTTVEAIIESRRTGLARPRHRSSVAARVTPAIFPRTVATVPHPGCRFAAPWLPSATSTPVSATQSYPSPEFETTIKTHRSDVVPRFSPIHF